MNALKTAQTNYTEACNAFASALAAFHQMVAPYEVIESDESREIIYAEAYAFVGYTDAQDDLRAAEQALLDLAFTTLRKELDWNYGALLDYLSAHMDNLTARRRVIAALMKWESK